MTLAPFCDDGRTVRLTNRINWLQEHAPVRTKHSIAVRLFPEATTSGSCPECSANGVPHQPRLVRDDWYGQNRLCAMWQCHSCGSLFHDASIVIEAVSGDRSAGDTCCGILLTTQSVGIDLVMHELIPCWQCEVCQSAYHILPPEPEPPPRWQRRRRPRRQYGL